MSFPALLLAAGASRRLGSPKQRVLVEGEALLHRAARVALEAGFDPVWVVLGSEGDALAPLVSDLPVRMVFNPAWEEGMASSLKAGIQAMSRDADALLVMVCDQLCLTPDVLRELEALFLRNPGQPAACWYDGHPGVPAIFPRTCFPELAHLEGDAGARALLRNREITCHIWQEGDLDLDEAKALETYNALRTHQGPQVP